jgi:hypothetical protein
MKFNNEKGETVFLGKCKDNQIPKHYTESETKVEGTVSIDGKECKTYANPERSVYVIIDQEGTFLYHKGPIDGNTLTTYTKPEKPAKEPKAPKEPKEAKGKAAAGVDAGNGLFDKSKTYLMDGTEVKGDVLLKNHGMKASQAMLNSGKISEVKAEEAAA